MDSTIYIFGHKNPDTDSICSAIAYEKLKRKMGHTGATAYRLGDLNKETAFVLAHFNIDPPPLLADINMRLRDLDLYHPCSLNKNDPLKKAWDAIQNGHGARLMPIVDRNGILEGIVSLADITKIFMEIPDEEIVSRYEIRFENFLSILEGRLVSGDYPYEYLEGVVHMGSAMIDEKALSPRDVIITSKTDTARHYANDRKCGLVILTNGYTPVELNKAQCAVMCVKYSLYKTVSLINHAISISSVMNTHNFESFSTENTVEDAAQIMKTSHHRNFPVVDRKGRLSGVVSRRHLIDYERKKVILMDHNERQQSVAGLDQANIVEIIDHHRVADIQTDLPLYIRSEPVGCTATIVHKLYHESNVMVDKPVAGLLLSAILSDTLMFRSPTCTADDRAAAESLAEIAGVDIHAYGADMFGAGTSLDGFTAEEILTIDRKQFSFGKYLIYISQVNTLDFNAIVQKKDALLEAMDSFWNVTRCDIVILMITDILLDGSEILVSRRGKGRELLTAAFGLRHDEENMFLPGVVSRKNQIVPKLTLASQMV